MPPSGAAQPSGYPTITRNDGLDDQYLLTLVTRYAISVFVTAPGQYILEFDNQECDVRKTPAKATVDWKLFRVEAG